MKALEIKELFDLTHTLAKEYLEGFTYPWEALAGLKDFVVKLGESLPKDEYDEVEEHIWIAKSAKVAPTASLTAPVIIGKNTEVRHCAFLRGSILVGENCVVGNSTELKNVILFDHVQVPHYNYVGDSILGYHAHMGAGSITSNVKGDKKPVIIKAKDVRIDTGRKKVGGMLGDYAEIGCGTVINPGSIIGKNTMIYPLSMVRGYIPENSVYKNQGEVVNRQDD